MIWKGFPHYWSTVDFPHNCQLCGGLKFLPLSLTWTIWCIKQSSCRWFKTSPRSYVVTEISPPKQRKYFRKYQLQPVTQIAMQWITTKPEERGYNTLWEYTIWMYIAVCDVWCMKLLASTISKFMGSTWGPSGPDRAQVGPMLTPWILPSGFPTQIKYPSIKRYK